MKRFLLTSIILWSLLSVNATIPLDYYSSLQGKSGAELKTAIHNLVKEENVLSYGSGNRKTWWGFYATDRLPDNSVRDRYSYEKFYFGDRGNSVAGMNIEHSFPKSWWGGTEVNAYKDLFNLMPCESSINQSKSNYPMGIVDRVVTSGGDNGCTKVGLGPDGVNRYWEPADQWKGDFARGYMYMATAYQDYTWTGDQSVLILEQGDYPTLQEWAYTLYMQWARQDKVDDIETTRNDVVEVIQSNRNPYVDFPNLMEYVWGDSIDVPLELYTTVKSAPFTGVLIDDATTPETIYDNSWVNDPGDCTIETTTKPNEISSVWINDKTYGWVAKAWTGKATTPTKYAADAKLVTPELDLTHHANIYATFEHACMYAKDENSVNQIENLCHIYVRTEDGVEHPVSINRWPDSSNWTYFPNKVNLSPYSGKKVKMVFHYTSTPDVCPTWEVRNFAVTGSGTPREIDTTGIPQNIYEAEINDTPAEFYSLDGCRVNPINYHGIVVRRQGGKATKLFIK